MNAQDFGLKQGQDLKEGRYCTAMQELRQAGLVPWSTENAMDGRNEVPLDHPRWHHYIDTDFGIAGSKSHIYLIPHSARLRAVTPVTQLTDGGLPLRSGMVTMYHRDEVILGRDLTDEEARASPVWFTFADKDQGRLDKYVEKVFCYGRSKGITEMMGVFVPEDEIERAVVLDWLDLRSQAGGLRLNNGARLVGVPGSEATVAPTGRRAKKSSPFRKDPRSDLENFLSQHGLSPKGLSKAVELYKTAQRLKI